MASYSTYMPIFRDRWLSPKSYAAATDEELMRRVQAGETEGMGELFRRHGERLYRYCWRMNQNRQLSEDLVQEAFARALRFQATFREGHRFEPWIYQILRNLQTDYWRRQRFEGDWDDQDMATEAGSGLGADAEVAKQQETELLYAALARLPAEKRELLVLARFEERPHAEIGAMLGCGEGAVRVRLCRALESLRQEYRKLLERRTK